MKNRNAFRVLLESAFSARPSPRPMSWGIDTNKSLSIPRILAAGTIFPAKKRNVVRLKEETCPPRLKTMVNGFVIGEEVLTIYQPEVAKIFLAARIKYRLQVDCFNNTLLNGIQSRQLD